MYPVCLGFFVSRSTFNLSERRHYIFYFNDSYHFFYLLGGGLSQCEVYLSARFISVKSFPIKLSTTSHSSWRCHVQCVRRSRGTVSQEVWSQAVEDRQVGLVPSPWRVCGSDIPG